ncbi:MAG: outer membrane beta-barrel protein [Treponemataceae bacterium]|nr:outer membrane beta-barrel protein [Treponemataceae bacterium]
MKKVLVSVAAATIFGSLAFAEKVMEVGVKGGLLLNAGTKITKEYKDVNDVDPRSTFNEKMTLGGDVGIFGHFGLVDLGPGTLSLQPEVFFSFANGLRTEEKQEDLSYKESLKYNSLDIAILVGYDIPVGKISIRPFLGPKVGIPIGKLKQKYETDGRTGTNKLKTKGATIGMDFGCGIAIPLGKFVLGADVRYGIDFNKVKAQCEVYDEDGDYAGKKDFDVLRRGALGINITAGYRF